MRWLVNLLMLCALAPAAAHAKKADEKVTYDLTVTDEAGSPVEAATVWSIGDTMVRNDLGASDMARLVSRHGQDVDIVYDSDLHPSLDVWRTDLQGRLSFTSSSYDVAGLKRVRRHFAVFKRGFVTAQLSDETRTGTQRQLQVKLVRDPQATADERMLALDRLHARARTLANGAVNLELARALKEVDAELRVLAADLESRGMGDQAAAAYVTLAYLPSVETARDSEGRQYIAGITNRFRPNVPRRLADLERAMKLQRSHPMLEYTVLWSGYVNRNIDLFAWGPVPMRAGFLKESRALLDEHGNRLWPEARHFLWQALIREKDFSAACEALRAYHQAEPSTYHRERWARMSKQYREEVRTAGGPADARCELPLAKD